MRQIVEIIDARATSDGDGVQLKRVFGGPKPERFDPFLMLDEFGSEQASDYIGGFPAHPHRGFETITYMLKGKMEHRDHMGNVGLLQDGGVQWMTAGRGVIHSEMPKQTDGLMRGFQLWVNLPAAKKMQNAHYEDVSPDAIPHYQLDGATIKAIAGQSIIEGQAIAGYFQVADTEVLYLHIKLDAGKSIRLPIEDNKNALVYLSTGELLLDDKSMHKQQLARLSGSGDLVIKNTGSQQAELLVLAGRALNEPIVQYGPFVMNSREEIDQAMHDFQNGTLTDN